MRLTVYLYPSVIFVDKSLLGRTMIERDASEFGKRPSLINFVGNHISIRYHPYTMSAYFGGHSDPPTHFARAYLVDIIYKPHYDYQNFSPLANGTDLNRQKYAILQTHWH